MARFEIRTFGGSPYLAKEIAVLAAATLLGGCSLPERRIPMTFTQEDEGAVRRVHDAYPSAWLANDAEKVMELFADDAVLLPHHGIEPIRGIAAIRKFFWPETGPAVTVSRYELTPDEIEGSGDLAYIRGRFVLALEIANEAKDTYSNAGNYLMIFSRGPTGEWRITCHTWNDPVDEIG
jgi:uncharacterized protein (TIGR02246 family)